MINLWYNISVNKTRVNLQNKITGGDGYEKIYVYNFVTDSFFMKYKCGCRFYN